MALSSHVDVLLSLRDGFERFATKTDEIGHTLESELRHLLEQWDERVQKARIQERECLSDLSDAQRDLRWCEGRGNNENPANCSYEQERVEEARRALFKAQTHLQLVSRSARELQLACEAFQKHGLTLRQIATQTAPSASTYLNTLLRDVELNSYLPPANGVSVNHTSSGGVSGGVVLPEKTLNPKIETAKNKTVNAAYQSRISSSARGLAALLRGEVAPTSPPDAAQIELAAQQLRALAELAPGAWEQLPEPGRVAALHSVEGIMAQLQGRPSAPIILEGDDRNSYGGYDPQAGYILLNRSFVLGAGARETVETIVHTGRHVYQVHAMRHPAFHSNPEEVGRWRINHLYYLHADVWGEEAYRNQPVERDAFDYTEAVIQQLYGATQ